MKKWMLAHRTSVGWIGAGIALAVAVVYFFIIPAETARAEGIGWVILRFGHSLVWVLLALAGAGFALRWREKLVGGLAWSALGVYAAFLVTLLVVGPLS